MTALLSKARPRSRHASTPLADSLPDVRPQDPAAAPLMIPADAREMLHLMRSTRGRVQGDVVFRSCKPLQSSCWQTSYCYVNLDTGSLRYETRTLDTDAGKASEFETLLPDLRACAVHAWYDRASKTSVLYLASADASVELDLRPKDDSHFNRWFAALLCWHPLRLGQDIQSTVKPLLPAPLKDPSASESQAGPLRKLSPDDENTILKKDMAILLDADISASTAARRISDDIDTPVTCSLRANGELSILAESDASVCATVNLGQIPRSAIQRLSKSVFEKDRVIAIYPQYAHSADACSRLRPICVAFSTRGLYEAWFVLLRSSAAPEIYGTSSLSVNDTLHSGDQVQNGDVAPLLRMEQCLEVRVTKARLRQTANTSEKHPVTSRKFALPASYYAEILLDEHVKAKTVIRPDLRGNLFWNESHVFQDTSSALRSVAVRIRRVAYQNEVDARQTRPGKNGRDLPSPKGLALQQALADEICGEVIIDLSELAGSRETDKTWRLTDDAGSEVGDLTLSIDHQKQDVLMEREYHRLFDFLQDFSNSLTLKIHDHMPAQLSRLAEYLLNVFQTAERAVSWFQSLVEAEIYDSQPKPPVAEEVSPAQSTATRNDSHAFILFRGTTLLSKALDAFMRRCGEQYLEDTIGSRVREITNADLDCEVDPSKLPPSGDILRNWQQLVTTTKSLWVLIYQSASKCPDELRSIFRHIRDCAHDRYGDTISSIGYTSVSGFLFLRFFCAAILNPRTFGLVQGEPNERTKRALMLVAKSLQGLANLTAFGKKETWMAPMDDFCTQHRAQFEEYIDTICAPVLDTSNKTSFEDHDDTGLDLYKTTSDTITNGTSNHRVSSATNDATFTYTTGPLAAMTRRLAPIAREGYLSLPCLIDPARNLAALVDLWLDHGDSTGNRQESMVNGAATADEDLVRFHRMCTNLRQKTRAYAAHIDQAADPVTGRVGTAQQKWVVLAERIEANPALFWRAPSADAEPEKSNNTTSRKTKAVETSLLAVRPATSPAVSPNKGKGRANTFLARSSDKSDESRRGSVFLMSGGGSQKSKDKEKSRDGDKEQKVATKSSSSDPGNDARPGSSGSMHGSAGSKRTVKSDTGKRRVSPPRSKEDLALRKLGWL